MVFIRGNRAQFDAWESLGNEGWNWNTIFEYSKRAENFTIPSRAQLSVGVTYNADAHGESGPLKTGYVYELENSTFHEKLQQSFEAQGLPMNQDLDDGETRGFASYPQTIDRDANVRQDAARAYYYPVEDRQNLRIINGTVKRIIWTAGSDEGLLIADGLEYVNPAGDLLAIKAANEVILSAGSWRTPIILEGSGVGNPRHVNTKSCLM
jgi:choline dehydrogenase